jgi:hypothetical protein
MDVRRVVSPLLLLLIAVLSVSHHRVSLLPSRHLMPAHGQGTPRSSRAELPVSPAASIRPARERTERSRETSRCVAAESSRFSSPPSWALIGTDPAYLRPHLVQALCGDLPPPAVPSART